MAFSFLWSSVSGGGKSCCKASTSADSDGEQEEDELEEGLWQVPTLLSLPVCPTVVTLFFTAMDVCLITRERACKRVVACIGRALSTCLSRCQDLMSAADQVQHKLCLVASLPFLT